MTDKTQSKLKVTQADRDAAAEVALLPCPHCSAIPQPYSTRDDGLWFQHPVGACVLSKFRFSSLCAYLWNTRTPSVSSEATYRMNADEHDAMFQAQMDSVEVRGQLSRPSSEASELVEMAFAGEPRQWSAAAENAVYDLPLIERLRIRWCDDSSGCRKSWARNPDGPEAADLIASLTADHARDKEVERASRPFVNRLAVLEHRCKLLNCGVPHETNVRTDWLRELRTALTKESK
jgi:hypothetical protein